MKMKSIKHILSVILLLAIVLPMSATEEKSPVDVQEVLWGHIKDSYEWHVTDIGHTHITLHAGHCEEFHRMACIQQQQICP